MAKRSLEDFRGDYSAVASLMQRSWAENGENPLLYTEEFLRSAFAYPGTGSSLAPTLYLDSEPIAFIAGFPRAFSAEGKPLNIALNTFLTAAPEFKGKGYGLALWSEFVKRAKKTGFDGTIGFCVEGEEMNASILGCSRAFGYRTERIFSIPYVARIVRPSHEPVESADEVDIFLEAAAAIVPQTAFARQWTREEAEWQCHGRCGAVGVAHSVEGRRGILTGYVMQVADADRTNCLLVDDILWGSLQGDERGKLLEKFLQQAGAEGAKLAVAPQMGYADMDPFTTSGRFRRTRRLMHAYLTVWNSEWPLSQPLNSIYADVF